MKSILDIEKIDWDKCDIFATSNLVKKICLFKNNNPNILNKEIAIEYHLHPGTIKKYLVKGKKFDWCYYNEHNERSLAASKKVAINVSVKPVLSKVIGFYAFK